MRHRATGDVTGPVHCHRPMASAGTVQSSTSRVSSTTHLWACAVCNHLTEITDRHPKEA